jgi:signal-transduction protein with cAMP-binding, CBS, and nucleotidyltransferase domain
MTPANRSGAPARKRENIMKTVKDLLNEKGSAVWSISPQAKVFEALKLMSEKQIGALMVLDDKGGVAGIITERDYARKVILLGKTSKECAVEEIMTPADRMFYIKPGNTVEECMVLMTGKHVRHLPVCDESQFAGLISIGDVVKSIISEKETLINQLSDYIGGKYL